MATLIELEEKFKPVFSKEQSSLLAETIAAGSVDSVKKEELNGLEIAVTDIRETANTLKTDMTTVKTDVSTLKTDVSTLKTDVNILKTDVDTLKTDMNIMKTDMITMKTDVNILKTDMNTMKTDMNILKTDMNSLKTDVNRLSLRMDSVETSLKTLAKQVGGLSESFGGSLEDFSMEVVPELLEKHWQMQIESTSIREEIDINGKPIEFDLVIQGIAEGKRLLVLGEVKSNVTADEARRFFRIADKLRKTALDYELRLIFFGYRVKSEAKQLIRENGAYMFFTNGRILQH